MDRGGRAARGGGGPGPVFGIHSAFATASCQQRAQRGAEAVGADASTLDGLPVARRREFLDEAERDLPADDAPPRTAPAEDAASSAEVNVDWERRVQYDALRDGNALKQNDMLQRAIQRDA